MAPAVKNKYKSKWFVNFIGIILGIDMYDDQILMIDFDLLIIDYFHINSHE